MFVHKLSLALFFSFALADFPAQALDTDVIDGVITIQTEQSIGAGFTVSQDQIITAAHVVTCAGSIEIVLQSDKDNPRPAVLVYIDDVKDIAILEVDTMGIKQFELAENLPEVGAEVFAIGSPIGAPVLSKGLYEGLSYAGSLTASVPIAPGNSGGPLLDEMGKVIGLVQAVQMEEPKLLIAADVEVITEAQNGITRTGGNPITYVTDLLKADWSPFLIIFFGLSITIILIAVSSRKRRNLPRIVINEEELKWWN